MHGTIAFPSVITLPTAEILSGKKCVGISGFWVLNEIIQKKNPENTKKNHGSRLRVTC